MAYTYDDDKQKYVGNYGDHLQTGKVSIYSNTYTSLLYGTLVAGSLDSSSYRCFVDAALIRHPNYSGLRDLIANICSERDLNRVIITFGKIIRYMVDNSMITPELPDDVFRSINHALDRFEEIAVNVGLKDKCDTLDLIASTFRVYIYVPAIIDDIELIKLIGDSYVKCHSVTPIGNSYRMLKEFISTTYSDAALPQLKYEITSSEGNTYMTIRDAIYDGISESLYVDSKMLDSRNPTKLDELKSKLSYHIRALFIKHMIDSKDICRAISAMTKYGYSHVTNVEAKVAINNEVIYKGDKTIFGDMAAITRDIHIQTITDTMQDEDFVWLRRFHKYYTILLMISDITGIVSVVHGILSRGKKKDEKKTHTDKNLSVPIDEEVR